MDNTIYTLLEKLIEVLGKDNSQTIELKAKREIYSGASAAPAYTAPTERDFVITHVWAHATSGTSVTLECGPRTCIKGKTNSQDFLYSEMPCFLRKGEALDLTGSSTTWYIVGYSLQEL